MSKKTSTLLLSPRDGLFLKDGRGWTTSATGRAHTLPWPLPSTVRGALRHTFGLQLQAQGRTLALDDWPRETAHIHLSAMVAVRRPHNASSWRREHIMWPRPADLVPFRHEGEDHARFVSLRPGKDHDDARIGALGLDDEPLTQAILRLRHPTLDLDGKPEAGVSPWLDDGEFVGWLLDETPPVTPAHQRALTSRDNVHVAINPTTQTATDGLLYSTTTLETLEPDAEWAIAARVQHHDKIIKAWPGAGTLGGKQRLTTLAAEDDNSRWNAPEKHFASRFVGATRLRLVLTTPARFAQGWLPDGLTVDARGDICGTLALHRYDMRPIALPPVRLVAACVGRPLAASGWDMARGQPKRGVRLVPAGSVYFFELLDGATLSEKLAEVLWLAQLGSSLPDDHPDQDGFRTQDGLGCVVPGLWNT
jgi:CRISPR-associated protein Cmr3